MKDMFSRRLFAGLLTLALVVTLAFPPLLASADSQTSEPAVDLTADENVPEETAQTPESAEDGATDGDVPEETPQAPEPATGAATEETGDPAGDAVGTPQPAPTKKAKAATVSPEDANPLDGYELTAEYDMTVEGSALKDVTGNGHDAPYTNWTLSNFTEEDGDKILTFPTSNTDNYAKIPNGVIYDEYFAVEVQYRSSRIVANSLLWNIGTRRGANTKVNTLNNYLNFHPNIAATNSVKVALKDSSLDGEKTATAGTVSITNTDFTKVLVIFEEGTVTIYQNGVEIGTPIASDYSIQDILDTGVSDPSDAIGYIGRAFSTTNTSANNFRGSLTSFKIYNRAFTDADALDKAVADLNIPGDTGGKIRGNITLPASGRNGVEIAWTSSNESVVNTKWQDNGDYDDTPPGVVTRLKSGDVNVTLTATLTRGEQTRTKTFNLIVKQAPTVLQPDYYLFTHFIDEGNANQEQVYFATSKDGLHFRNMSTANDPILTSTIGEKGVRDMCTIRSAEGDHFYLIATDLSIFARGGWGGGENAQVTGSQKIVVWESDDLVNWSEPRLARVASKAAGMAWAPEGYYDEKTGEYIVFFSSNMNNRTQVYYAKTRDFYTFTEAKPFVEHTDVIDATVTEDGDYYYRASKYDGNGSSNIYLQRVPKADGLLGTWQNYISLAGSKNSSVYGNTSSGNATGYYASNGPAMEGPEFYKLFSGDTVLMADRFGNGTGYVPFLLPDMNDTSTWRVMADSEFDFATSVKKRHGNILPVTQAEYMAVMEEYTDGHVTDVSLGADEVSTYVGSTKTLKATLTPADPIDASVTWSSSDPGVATVDATGKITALKEGETIITVTTVDGGLTDTCKVTVTAEPPPAVPLAYFDFNTAGSGTNNRVFNSVNGATAIATARANPTATNFQRRAKGADYESSDYALYMAGSTAQANRNYYLGVTNSEGGSLLTGLEEITISYDASPLSRINDANWPLYLAPNTNAQTYASERYVGSFHAANTTRTEIERYNSGRGNTGAKASVDHGANNTWHHIDCVLTPTETKLYLNGVLQSTVTEKDMHRLTNILGDSSIIQIGRANWGTNGEFFNGLMDNVAIYDRELLPSEIRKNYYATTSSTNVLAALNADAAALSVPEVAISDIALPKTGANGSTITWASADEYVISTRGAVTRPDSAEQTVKLTATLTLAGQSVTKEYEVLVLAEGDKATIDYLMGSYDVGIEYVTDDITLPTTLGYGTSVEWKTAPAGYIAADGRVTRPAVGEGDKNVTLTAIVTLGDVAVEKDFDLTVAEADYGDLLTYTHPAPSSASDVTYGTAQGARFATATGGDAFAVLNSGKPVLYSKIGQKRMTWPSVARRPDGGFVLIAANNNASDSVTVYDSADLTKFTDGRLVQLNTSSVNVREVAAVYDNGVRAYRVYWRGTSNTYYETITDLSGVPISVSSITQADHAAALTKAGYVGTSFTYPTTNGTQGSALGLTKAEYDKVNAKYARVKNTGVEGFASFAFGSVGKFAASRSAIELPERATLNYSDGSSKTMAVEWDAEDIAALEDIDSPGEYTIDGAILQKTYDDPFIKYRADPYVTKGSDGYYYFTASYPTVGNNDLEGYDRIVLRRSKTIEGLGGSDNQNQKANANEIVIWDESSAGSTFNRYVWAPEIHEINGIWYVFFTTSSNSGSVWGVRPALLTCGGDGDPFKAENWLTPPTRFTGLSGETGFNAFSLDMTYFESGGKSYIVWAHKPGDGNTSTLRIATVAPSDPSTLTSLSTLLAEPEYTWETGGNDVIEEGPAVIKIGGKVFLAYAAASVDARYCIGSLTADEGANLLERSVWEKNPYPILATEDLVNQNGPGHNSFTVDEYGNPIIVYHARTPGEHEGTGDGGLADPGRHARIKPVHFAADGSVVFNMTPEEELDPAYQDVRITITVGEGERGKLKEALETLLEEIGNPNHYLQNTRTGFETQKALAEALLADQSVSDDDASFAAAIEALSTAKGDLDRKEEEVIQKIDELESLIATEELKVSEELYKFKGNYAPGAFEALESAIRKADQSLAGVETVAGVASLTGEIEAALKKLVHDHPFISDTREGGVTEIGMDIQLELKGVFSSVTQVLFDDEPLVVSGSCALSFNGADIGWIRESKDSHVVVSLYPSFINTLENGTYTLKVLFSDVYSGVGVAKVVIARPVPQTPTIEIEKTAAPTSAPVSASAPAQVFYLVWFNANGGKISSGSSGVRVEQGAAIGNLPGIAARKGYTFRGWYTAPKGGDRIDGAVKATEDTIYYAQWTANQYKLALNANGGKVGTKTKVTKTVTYDARYGKLGAPTKERYKFLGWYTKKTGGVKVTADTRATAAKNLTVYAHWKKKTLYGKVVGAVALYVRSKPSYHIDQTTIVGYFPKGKTFRIVAYVDTGSSGWYKINHNGRTVYVYAKYVKAEWR